MNISKEQQLKQIKRVIKQLIGKDIKVVEVKPKEEVKNENKSNSK